jgi:hypothetical protein
VVIGLALLLCCLAAGILAAGAKWLVSSEFGKVEISLRNGKKVYAIRETRGLSSETLAFTRNPDGCAPADSANDYVIRNPSKTEVLYAVTHDGLTIYDYDRPIDYLVEEPTNPWSGIKVNLHKSREPFYLDVYADPAKYGATLTQIPLNQTCWRYLFRSRNRPR